MFKTQVFGGLLYMESKKSDFHLWKSWSDRHVLQQVTCCFYNMLLNCTVRHSLWHTALIKSVPHFAAGAPVFRRLRRLSAADAPVSRRQVHLVFRRLMCRMRLVIRHLRRLSAAVAPDCSRCACF
jgi:hypothetical protein